jgi:hypothetical protein
VRNAAADGPFFPDCLFRVVLAVSLACDMNSRRAILLCLASIAAVCMVGVVDLLYELPYTPTYDQADPDYRRYRDAFDSLQLNLDRRGITEEDYVDLAMLNNGEWTTACLFGGYTMPLDGMRALGTYGPS